MFKTISELQDFILWAKKAKVKSFKQGQTEIVFSDIAIIDSIEEANYETAPTRQTEEKDTSKTLVDTLQEEDEDDLYWSSRP